MAWIQGLVIDNDTSFGVVGATVTLADSAGKSLGYATASDAQGKFSMVDPGVANADRLIVTSVGYQPKVIPYATGNYYYVYMDKDVVELPEVIVTPKPQLKISKPLMYGGIALLGVLALKDRAKKKVSGLLPGGPLADTLMPVIIVGGLYVAIKYGDSILETLGIKKPKEEKEAEQAINDPGSYWGPEFWKAGGAGTMILTGAAVQELIALLRISFGPFNDDEQQVINAFKKFKTQSQLSYFADQFEKIEGKRLADWLFKNSWPDDRLSLSEMAEIDAYIKKLPQFRI